MSKKVNRDLPLLSDFELPKQRIVYDEAGVAIGRESVFSHSQMTSCERLLYARALGVPLWSKSTATAAGSAFHETVAEGLKRKSKQGGIMSVDEALELSNGHMAEMVKEAYAGYEEHQDTAPEEFQIKVSKERAFDPKGDLEAQRTAIMGTTQFWAENQLPDQNPKSEEHVEMELFRPLSGVQVHGIVDLIEVGPDGNETVVDHKTAGSPSNTVSPSSSYQGVVYSFLTDIKGIRYDNYIKPSPSWSPDKEGGRARPPGFVQHGGEVSDRQVDILKSWLTNKFWPSLDSLIRRGAGLEEAFPTNKMTMGATWKCNNCVLRHFCYEGRGK